MKLIESCVEVIKEEDPYKLIELAGRTCYKSEDKITEDSAKEFVDRMIKLGHGAMLEHGTVYLFCDRGTLEIGDVGRCKSIVELSHNKYSKSNWLEDGLYITTNYRVLVENGWLDVLKYICEPTKYHERRIAVKFTCDRGVSHEIVRHRVMSFAMESQRYCNYGKDKFNNEITFIIPSWIKNLDVYDNIYGIPGPGNSTVKPTEVMPTKANDENVGIYYWLHGIRESEKTYLELIERGWKPQEARAVLPNATKTEIVVTGFETDWAHFFKLRYSSKAHPDIQKLAKELYFKLYGKEYSEEE